MSPARPESVVPQTPSPQERVKVRVELPVGRKPQEARLACDATVRALIPGLVSSLGLPSVDDSGSPYEYRLRHGNREIGAGDTLRGIGITDGASIALERGSGSFPANLEKQCQELMSLDLESNEKRKVRSVLETLGRVHQSFLLSQEETTAPMARLLIGSDMEMERLLLSDTAKEFIKKEPNCTHWPGDTQSPLPSTDGVSEDAPNHRFPDPFARLRDDYLTAMKEVEGLLREYGRRSQEATGTPHGDGGGADPQSTERTRVRLHLDCEFDEFGSEEAEVLMESVARLVSAHDGELELQGVERGSVKVTFTLSPSLAPQLLDLYEGGSLEDLGVSTLEFCRNEKALPAVEPPPVELLSVEMIDQLTLTVEFGHDARVGCSLAGALAVTYPNAGIFKPEVTEMNRVMADIGRDMVASKGKWLQNARREGKGLYTKLFTSCPALLRAYHEVMGRVGNNPADRCQIVFSGPRGHLAMPWELLHDDGCSWLALQHPICRRVTQVTCRRPSFRNLLAQLRRGPEPKPLRVLLLASEEHGGMGTREEICRVRQRIEEGCKASGLVPPVFTPQTPAPSGQNVKNELSHVAVVDLKHATDLMDGESYHIIHYAGHGEFDPERPHESGFRLLSGNGYATLYAHSVHRLLDGKADTGLVYLSCCDGARVANDPIPQGGEFLGLLDAVVMSGVPVALGYRWFVRNMQATVFADHFYQSLFDTLSPSHASLYARKRVGFYSGGSMTDETSLSPILVVQSI